MRNTSGRQKGGAPLDSPRSDHLSSMDATDHARWREARVSDDRAAPSLLQVLGHAIASSLVAANTSMLHHCPLDTSSTTDRHRRPTHHCLGRRLAPPRHRRLSPPPSLPTKLDVEASPLLPHRRGLQAMPCCRMILGRPLYAGLRCVEPDFRASRRVYVRPLRSPTPHTGLET
eukprot:scaffold29798_cov42-Phaeocystis_antarctica.AAC.1